MKTYIAPTVLSAFHRSDAFVRGVMGPIGSGKSTGCSWEIFRRLQEQKPDAKKTRKTRWAVVRNTYRELADTTVKTWRYWFDEVGSFDNQNMVHSIRFGCQDGTTVEAEVLFRALDRPQDVKKLLSLELTGAWVNEAREISRGVIDMLQGRVGRYPAALDGGPTWFGVIMDTNPPDQDHWWYSLFEELRPNDWRIFRQPSGLDEKAENIGNLPSGYYTRLMQGKKDEWVKVYIHGEYGFVTDGKPVYPEFIDSVHVAKEPLKAIPGRKLIVGVDFGLTPAAIFMQQDVRGRWLWLHELVTEDMGAVRFSELLKNEMQQRFAGFDFEIYGDPAGDDRSQVDERTAFQILQGKGLSAAPAPTNDPVIRREAVVAALNRMIDGKPGFQMSPTMIVTRKGMGGGYCYKRLQVTGDERYHDKPYKNRFSHPCEAGQYGMIGAGEGNAVIGAATKWAAPIKYPEAFARSLA